jgi:hypothetical protein
MSSPKPLTPARKAREVRKLQQQLTQLQQQLALLQARPAQTPCAECQHFLKQSQQCLSWGSRVPEEYVGHGCERFTERTELPDEDEIPF